MPIMAHHAGLYDYADFLKRMEAEVPVGILNEKDIKLEMPKDKPYKPQDLHHLVRVLYSCLVDADFRIQETIRQILNAMKINLLYSIK